MQILHDAHLFQKWQSNKEYELTILHNMNTVHFVALQSYSHII